MDKIDIKINLSDKIERQKIGGGLLMHIRDKIKLLLIVVNTQIY